MKFQEYSRRLKKIEEVWEDFYGFEVVWED